MAQLEINLTLKGEKGETTFKLFKGDSGFGIKGISEESGEKILSLKHSQQKNIFEFSGAYSFEEDDEEINDRLISLVI